MRPRHPPANREPESAGLRPAAADKRSKRQGITSGETPGPSSSTHNRAIPAVASTLTDTRMRAWLRALSIRLCTSWCRRRSSPATMALPKLPSTESVVSLEGIARTIACATSARWTGSRSNASISLARASVNKSETNSPDSIARPAIVASAVLASSSVASTAACATSAVKRSLSRSRAADRSKLLFRRDQWTSSREYIFANAGESSSRAALTITRIARSG